MTAVCRAELGEVISRASKGGAGRFKGHSDLRVILVKKKKKLVKSQPRKTCPSWSVEGLIPVA